MIESFCEALRSGFFSEPYSEVTTYNYKLTMRRFFQRFPEFNPETVEQFLMENKRIKARIQDLKVLKLFARFSVKRGKLSSSDAAMIEALRYKAKEPPKQTCPTLPQYQEIQYQSIQDDLDALIVAVLGCTGMRVSEFHALEMQHIDLVSRQIRFYSTKTYEWRKVGINDYLHDTLNRLCKREYQPEERLLQVATGRLVTIRTLRRRVKALGFKVGADISPHSFRHFFVTNNHEKGRALSEIQLAVGHRSVLTTRRYVQTTQDDVAERMKQW